MEVNGSNSSAPGSSQSGSEEMPFFPPTLLNFHVQPPTLSQGYETICQPYKQDKCRLKGESSKGNTSRYMSDFKKPLDERRLVQAASMNDVTAVTNLLNRGVSPNCSDILGRSAIHVAACKGYARIVRTLLERGANPNSRDTLGNTPLHLAACTNNIDVVLLLLRAGTDACSCDVLGRSPLQLAQSKLKILQRAKFPDTEIKSQASLVIEMLLHFSKNSKKSSDVEALDLELLSSFQNRFHLSETRQDIDHQLSDLLNNLETLTIKPS